MNAIKRELKVYEHKTSHPHFDLTIIPPPKNVPSGAWIIRFGPSNELNVRRLAIEEGDNVHLSDAAGESLIDAWGEGPLKLWDSGSAVLLHETKTKIMFEVRSEKLSGTYCLLLPLSGRDTKKRIWELFRVR